MDSQFSEVGVESLMDDSLQDRYKKDFDETVLVCDVADACDRYWYDYWRHLGYRGLDIGGAQCFHNDIPDFSFQGVWWTDWLRCNPVGVHKDILNYYREKNSYFSWYVPQREDSEKLSQTLYNIGLEKTKTWVGVHAGSIDYRYVRIDPKFRLIQVGNAQQLSTFCSILAKEYRYEKQVVDNLREVFKRAGYQKTFLHFIAFYDGKPIGTASYMQSADRAYIYNLVIEKSMRRRGMATYLLQELVAIANIERIEKVVTLSRDESWPFFQSSGFEAFERYFLYSPRL